MAYLEGHSNERNNLVFHGFQEMRGETWDECEEAVRKVVGEDLEFPDAWD